MQTALMRQNPRRADELQRLAGFAVRRASNGSIKKGAWLLGITDRRMRQICAGECPSIFGRFLEALSVFSASPDADAAPLLGICQIVSHQSLIAGMDDNQLVSRFWKGAADLKRAIAAFDEAETGFAQSGETDALYEQVIEVNAAATRVGGLLGELRERGIDPRQLRVSK